MVTTTKASKPAAVHFRLPELGTTQEHPFSWVIAERPGLNNSSDSLTGSNETHQSSSVASVNDDLAGESTLSPPTRSKKAAALLGEPLIASPDRDLPLRGAQQASARKAALTKPKPKPVSKPASPTKQAGKSMGFMFHKRSKSPGPPPSQSIAPVEPMPAVPPPPSAEVRAQAPIHARFAKANRESWIEKKGSRGAAKGPIIPSRRGAPTLSFIAQMTEPEDCTPIAFVRAPAPSGTSRSGGSERAMSPVQRGRSPVQRAISPPACAVLLSPASAKSANPIPRVESPSPIVELEGSVSKSAIINIAYPRPAKAGTMDSTQMKPAPTGPLPLPPITTASPPRAVSPLPPRMTSPIQRTETASPPGIMSPTALSPTKTGRVTPTLPVSAKYQVTVQKREAMRGPSAYQSAPAPVDEPELAYTRGGEHTIAVSAPGSPVQRQDPPRAFSPAPSVASGLRRTPSLPPAKREQSPSVVRGRDHPFPTRPVERQRSANVNVPTFHLSVEGTDDPRLARVGFYMSPSSISATDVTSSSLHRSQRDRDLLSVDPFTRVSDAPSSVYSDSSSTLDVVERQEIMSENEHGQRRQNLIQNVGRLVLSDRRVLV